MRKLDLNIGTVTYIFASFILKTWLSKVTPCVKKLTLNITYEELADNIR